MKKYLGIIFIILLYATFLVPVVVIPSSFIFPFIVPKIVIFRSLVAALVAVFILLYRQNPDQFRLKPTPLTLALFAFIVSFALSTFFGSDAYHSFWDNHERMLGLFTVLHYFAYYLVVTTVLKTWTNWKWALRIFLLCGTIVTSIGMLEFFNPGILPYILPTAVANILAGEAGGRISALLGNAIYLGGYGLFLLAVSAVLIKREQLAIWRVIAAFCAAVALGAMYVSGTRGSFIGLGVGFVSAIALAAWTYRTNTQLRNWLVGGLALFFVVLGSMSAYRQTDFVQSIPMLGRILNSSLSAGTGSTRLIAWQIAITSWKERPIFGWGPNNFFYAFNAYYNPMSLRFGFGETWFDNAHNILLNTLTVQGIFGIITYLGIFVAAWWMLFKNKVWREKHSDLFIIFSSFLVAHLMQNLTVFENPTSYLFFMFWLALINSQVSDFKESVPINNVAIQPRKQVPPVSAPNVGIIAISLALVVTLGWVYVFNYEPAAANQDTLEALQVFQVVGSNPAAATRLIKSVLANRSPHIDDIRSDIARSVVSVLSSQPKNLDIATSQELINLVYPALKENIALHPRDIRNHLTAAQLGQLAYVVTKNPQYVFEAEKFLSDALVYSPRRQQLIYSLSGIEAQLGKKDEAIKLLQSTINDDPTINENYWRLAFLYQYLGELQNAKDVFITAHKNNVSFTDQGLQQEASVDAALAASNTKKK